MAEAVAKPKTVNKFEGRLLTIVRGIVGLSPIDAALPYIFERLPAPAGMGQTSVQLVCDSLAKGCVQYLAHTGGWRNERWLRNGHLVEGRLWERIPLEDRRLEFSRHALEFLIWLTANHPSYVKMIQPPSAELTPADELLMFLTYEALRDTEAGPIWRTKPLFARNALCRLHYPDELAAAGAQPVDMNKWLHGVGAAILETMQAAIAERWFAVEVDKRSIGDWKQLRALAESQDFLLDRIFTAAQAAQRFDLLRFLLWAAVRYCTSGRSAQDLVGGIQVGGPPRLAERYALQKQAAVLARGLERLAEWERQARGVSFLDDGYAVAQFVLQEWESAGAAAALTPARQLLQQLEPIRLESEGSANESSLSHSRS
jgi:hypothetical protein